MASRTFCGSDGVADLLRIGGRRPLQRVDNHEGLRHQAAAVLEQKLAVLLLICGVDPLRVGVDVVIPVRDTEQALGTGDNTEQIVAGGVEMLAAEPQHLAGHQHQLAAEHIVGGDTVFEAMHAAGIFRHVAANGTGDLRGRVGRVVKAHVFDRLRDRQVGHARFDDGDAIRDVSFQGSGCAISKASASMMTQAVKGKSKAEAAKLFYTFHKLVTTGEGNGNQSDLGKLAVFSGVSEFPVRVKCATLAWHTLQAALEGKQDPVSTE